MLQHFLILILISTPALAEKIVKRGIGPTGLPTTYTISTEYVHDWQSFPTMTGQKVGSRSKLSVKPKEGEAIVAIFLASWCLPCQGLIKDIKSLEEKFQNRHTRFVYVFSHDTAADAFGFQKTYKLSENAMLADVALMKDFHQPQLPSIYVADRRTWLVWRALGLKRKDLAELDQFLEYHTAN